MKIYEFITRDEGEQILQATVGDKVLGIPTDPANSDYAEYLRYTAWVDAGNDPQEFWTQETE